MSLKKILQNTVFSLFVLSLQGSLFAVIDVTASSLRSVVPVASGAPVIKFLVKDTSDSATNFVTRIKLTSIETSDEISTENNTFGFNTTNGFDSISIYEDTDDNLNFGSEDTLLKTHIDFGNTAVQITFTGQNISSANASSGKYYFIVIDVGDEMVGRECILELDEVEDNNSHIEVENLSVTFKASGIQLQTDEDLGEPIKPSHVFPGQKVAMFYLTAEAKGESVDDASIVISNEYNNFGGDDAISNVSLYYSSATDKEGSVTFNSSDESVDPYSYEIQSIATGNEAFTESLVTISDWNRQIITNRTDDVQMDKQNGFWVVYTLGDDISVTKNPYIEAEFESIFGDGDDSQLVVSTGTKNYSVKVPVAGVLIEEVTDITTEDVYGRNTWAPLISFKLRSYVATSNVNEINIINDIDGIPFATNSSETGITKIEIYEDNDGSETLSILDDKLVGSAVLDNFGNSATRVSVTTNIDLDIFDEDNSEETEKMLYVVYYFGALPSEVPPTGNKVTAEIGSVHATAEYSFFTVSKTHAFRSASSSNQNPLSTDSPVVLDLSDTIVSVVSVNGVVPDVSYEGQLYVPMLRVQVESEQNLSSMTFEIGNESNNFSADSKGVTAVAIFKDDGDNIFEYDPYDSDEGDSDILLSSRSTFSDTGVVTINNVEISDSLNTLFICYSLGQNTYEYVTQAGGAMRAQLLDIRSDTIENVAGNFPFPAYAVEVAPEEKLVKSIDLTSPSLAIDSTTTFNVTLGIRNSSTSDSIIVKSFIPKIYKNDISGIDISHEFITKATTDLFGVTIASNAARSSAYQIRHATPYSEGTGVLDAELHYVVGSSNPIVFSRYDLGEDWSSAVDESESFDITAAMISDSILPAYIKDPIKVLRSAVYSNFVNGAAVDEDDIIEITFLTPGSIDDSTLTIVKNGINLQRSSSLTLNSNRYTYVNGVIQFYVGDEDATVLINVKDTNGNAYDEAVVTYLISKDSRITSPLFYPSPYALGSGNLNFGFSITRPSDISLYIYNHVGQLVYSVEDRYFSAVGFNNLEIDSVESFLVPGMYVAFVKAVEKDGNQSVSRASTRFAIY